MCHFKKKKTNLLLWEILSLYTCRENWAMYLSILFTHLQQWIHTIIVLSTAPSLFQIIGYTSISPYIIYWRNHIICPVEFLIVWILLIASLWNHITYSFDLHISIIWINPMDLTTGFRLKLVVVSQEYFIGAVMFFHQETSDVRLPLCDVVSSCWCSVPRYLCFGTGIHWIVFFLKQFSR